MPRHKRNRSSPQKGNAEDVVLHSRPLVPVGLALILLTTVLVYLPAMNGGRLWDDDGHITKPELQSLSGLYHTWFTLGATQQYYPLLHTAFWVEHQLWGDSTLGYHLVNVLWHLLAVVLVYKILVKLNIPGALLATAIFALHPVMVESVAWITEQKNTLSAIFYLAAMRVYLEFDERRQSSYYAIALVLFVLGLLTKTVTATLPAALLVIFWWQRGSIDWKRDVLPLVPFFALGAAAGVMTARLERTQIGAQGAEFEMSFIERGLVAGRAIWFYFAKLVWPSNLIFFYPRWKPDTTVWWQWLFPIAAIAMTVFLWSIRHRWRAPLAAWLFFCGTLFPALGFLNVYPFIYSFVADHFQYLASLGIIVLAAAGITLAIARLPARYWAAANMCCCMLVAVLAVLTWKQSRSYSDSATLYRTTIKKNPDCWLAELNLGTLIAKEGQPDEAMTHFFRALEINPNCADAHSNVGIQLCTKGQMAEGMKHLAEAVRLSPRSAPAHQDFANGLVLSGKFDEAVKQCEIAVDLQPHSAFGRFSLGIALVRAQRVQEAINQFERAVELQPDYARAYDALARAYSRIGRPADAIAASQKASRLARAKGESEFAQQVESWLANYREQIGAAAPKTN